MNFVGFPKMGRWSRKVIVTEKIDGTNAQICIHNKPFDSTYDNKVVVDGVELNVRAASRTRWISIAADNYGFAKWVADHASDLAVMGKGNHFGEWWGQGIQRNYNLTEKRFSLFNAERWTVDPLPTCCSVVPILCKVNIDEINVDHIMESLLKSGSHAAPGFMKPEGIVIFHTHANVSFKKTFERDQTGKYTIIN